MSTVKSLLPSFGKFWGLGWALFYVVALYLLAAMVAQSTTISRSWQLAVISVAAPVSALAIGTNRSEPRGIRRPVLYTLHLLNLTYAIVFTVLGVIALLARIPR